MSAPDKSRCEGGAAQRRCLSSWLSLRGFTVYAKLGRVCLRGGTSSRMSAGLDAFAILSTFGTAHH
jgi:hypothetical protein